MITCCPKAQTASKDIAAGPEQRSIFLSLHTSFASFAPLRAGSTGRAPVTVKTLRDG